MCISSNSDITFPQIICNNYTKYTDSAGKYDICQFWIHIKCNNLNNINYWYLQGSDEANKNFLSMVMINPSPTTIKNNDADANNINSTSVETYKKAKNWAWKCCEL